MSESPQGSRHVARPTRATLLLVVVAFTVAASGFFMGLRATIRETRGDLTPEGVGEAGVHTHLAGHETRGAVDGPVGVARSYAEMRGGSRDVSSSRLDSLVPGDLAEAGPGSPEERRRQRLERRAFDGAPPVVPHPIDQSTPAACAVCHSSNTAIRGLVAPQMSHQPYASCTQCHVPAGGIEIGWNTSAYTIPLTTQFEGAATPEAGTRAYEGAPPVVPHTTWMRENCMSCHGEGGTSALRTTHPERQSCTQCHAPSATLDQRAFVESPFPLREDLSHEEATP